MIVVVKSQLTNDVTDTSGADLRYNLVAKSDVIGQRPCDTLASYWSIIAEKLDAPEGAAWRQQEPYSKASEWEVGLSLLPARVRIVAGGGG